MKIHTPIMFILGTLVICMSMGGFIHFTFNELEPSIKEVDCFDSYNNLMIGQRCIEEVTEEDIIFGMGISFIILIIGTAVGAFGIKWSLEEY